MYQETSANVRLFFFETGIALCLAACAAAPPHTEIVADHGLAWLARTDASSWTTIYQNALSNTHWGHLVEVRVNVLAKDIYRGNSGLLAAENEAMVLGQPFTGNYQVFPVGAQIIKAHRVLSAGPTSEIVKWTGMEKIPAEGKGMPSEWRYTEWDKAGNVELSGTERDQAVQTRCTSCHAAVQYRDSLYYHDLSQPTP